MDTDNTLLNAVVGAVATAVLSFTGISPLLGGAVAGYLEGSDTGDGIRVGALSGAIASIPIVGFLLLVLVLFPFFGLFGFPVEAVLAAGSIVVVGAIIVIGGVAYTVGLSALGGLIGAYANGEL